MITEHCDTVIDSHDTPGVLHDIVGVNGKVALQPQMLMGIQGEKFCYRIELISVSHHYERIQNFDDWLLNSSDTIL